MAQRLKSYKNYENDPCSRLQTTEYLHGIAEAPLPSSPQEAIHKSLINGHTLFRGESGVVMEASEVLDKDDRLTVELPDEGEYSEDNSVWERASAFKTHHAAIEEFGSVQGTSDVLQAIGANSVPPAAPKGALIFQITKDGLKKDIEVAYDMDPVDVMKLIRESMNVLPDVPLGYKLSTEPVRRAPHSLLTADELKEAMDDLKGMIRRGRGAKKFLQIVNVGPETATSAPMPSGTAAGHITTRLASKKEILAALESVDEPTQSTLATLWAKLCCSAPGHTKCIVDNKSIPPVHKPVSIRDATYWANQIVQGRATLTSPPNDHRWDHDKHNPHVSSASAGSSATKTRPLFTVRPGTSIISIPSDDSSTATVLEEYHDIKPSLKREYSFSPDLSASECHAHSKRRMDESTRPPLVVHEGVHYPTVTDVLVSLNKIFPLHAYLTYEEMMPRYQIYYAPDVAALPISWYVKHLGMSRSSAVHLCDYAALMTARVCHNDS
ncbi:hypothetical protein RhiJN_21345 [Ceratobasidium sp. AG-Ba]|nr:hypothetical protein RhiJN_21345 [Ceratobasidium sp. AG-Ba]